MANWITYHLYFNEKRHHILGQNFGILTIVCYVPLRSKMFCLLLCELQVRTRQSRCIEVVHPYFQFMISCLWFLRIIWDSFWILKRRKGVKGPGARNDTSKSPGCFNQILTFESWKWSPIATFKSWTNKSALSFFDFLLFHVQKQVLSQIITFLNWRKLNFFYLFHFRKKI